jgi:hypothetical protein
MKNINPVEALRQVGGGNPQVEEQAEIHSAAHGRIRTEPDPATGLPAKDATLNWGGGYSMSVNPGGPGDRTDFPEAVAGITGQRSNVDPEPQDFGHASTPVPEDGFGDRGSGIANITGRR